VKTLLVLCLCGLSIPLPAQTALRTFTNPDAIFQFKYSNVLVDCTSAGTQENDSGSSVPESCTSQGEMCGDAASGAITIACYAYPKDRFNDKPTFVAAAFFVAELKAATTQKACLERSRYWNVEGVESTTINKSHFKVFHVSDVGLGNSMSYDFYRTFHQKKCYELGIETAMSNSGAYEPGTIKEFTEKDGREVQSYLTGSLDSFRFVK
jgi:hypothetical protein